MKIDKVTMSWSGLEAMHCSMSSPTSKDTSSRGLGWHRTFTANLWSDEINLCAAQDNCVSAPYVDANFEKGNGTGDLLALDDSAYVALPLASTSSGMGHMRTLLEQDAEFDDFLPSLEQKMLESLIIAEDGQPLYQRHASNLQPFSVFMEQDDVKNESLSEQEHSRLCPNNVTSAVVTDVGDAALAGSIRSYFESLLGLDNGEDTEQSSTPMNLWKDPTKNLVSLVSVAKRHGLPEKRRRIESFPEIKKTQPSWQMLPIALASSCEYCKDPGLKKDLSHGLVGGNINVRKTRLLRLQRIEPLSDKGACPLTQVRLVMCDHEKGAAIDAGLQYKDNQYCDLIDANPHDLAFTMPNVCVADLFTKQLCALLEKEGYELMDDEFQLCEKVLIDSACMDLSSLILDSPSRENIQIPDEASISDCMLLSPVAERASFEITEARVGSSSRTLEINLSPVLPFDLQSQSQGQVPWHQARPSQFDIPLNVEPQNQLQQWEQMANPRRKATLPPVAWGA